MHDQFVVDNDSTTLVSQGDSVEEIARHGFDHDEQFLTMLQQVFFMYYNVGMTCAHCGQEIKDILGQAT